jgi:hypothetical protein
MTLKKSLLFLVVSLIVFSCLIASEEKSKSSTGASRPAGTNHVSGTLGGIKNNQIVVRVGDATKSYSFDNRTVFTSGNQSGSASDLRSGDEVVITTVQDKAVEVNGTQRIEGIVQSIDIEDEILTVQVGQQTKQFPFNHFRISSIEGKAASVLDMKAGDSVFIKVNVGFPKATSSKKPGVIKQ